MTFSPIHHLTVLQYREDHLLLAQVLSSLLLHHEELGAPHTPLHGVHCSRQRELEGLRPSMDWFEIIHEQVLKPELCLILLDH